MTGPERIDAHPFYDLAAGDKVVRLLAGVSPMVMEVERVDEKLIYMRGGWMFERDNGLEFDPSIGSGSEFGVAASFLTRDPV